MENVIAKNVRGPFPAGQCFQLNQSDHSVVENFLCLNELGKAWTEDTISAWRASDVTIKNGVVDGNNALTGIGVMYEGSSKEIWGGLTENVEVRNHQGCFSGYPSNGLVMKNNVCAQHYCDGTPERGRKPVFNLWQFGHNVLHEVWTQNNIVSDSQYEPLCETDNRLSWSAKQDPSVDAPTVTYSNMEEISEAEYVPKEALHLEFPWDGCVDPESLPSCEDFPTQAINDHIIQINVNNGEPIYVYNEGQCLPKEGNPKHPNEA